MLTREGATCKAFVSRSADSSDWARLNALDQAPPTIVTGCGSLGFHTLGGRKEHSPGSPQTYNVPRFGAAPQHIVRQFLQAGGIDSEIFSVGQ